MSNFDPTDKVLQKGARYMIEESTVAEWDSSQNAVKILGSISTLGGFTKITNNGSTPGSFGTEFINEDEGSLGAVTIHRHNSASPASGDEQLHIFVAKNDNAEDTPYAGFSGSIQDVSDGAEEGGFAVKVTEAGAQFTEYLRLNDNANHGIEFLRPLISDSDDIAAGVGGAISVATPTTTINTDADGDAFSLANGVDGQLKTIILVADGGGDAVITPTTLANGTTITLDTAGDSVVLQYNPVVGWVVVGGEGYAVA